MSTEPRTAGYAHRQKAPLCLLVYALAITFFALGLLLSAERVLLVMLPAVGSLLALLAASFHYLSVEDRGDYLEIRFGPVTLFRRTVRYADIESVEIGRTLLLDGWGIHYSVRGGWVWNLWGRTCVVVRFRSGCTLRIGTDDAEGLSSLLESRLSPPGNTANHQRLSEHRSAR